MNIENINKLIDHLRKTDPKSFDMGDWLSGYPHRKEAAEVLAAMEKRGGCGTSACIAGHAVILEAAENGAVYDMDLTDPEYGAINWLGLNSGQAAILFYRCDPEVKPLDAVVVLEHLRDSGVVDWSLSPHLKRVGRKY